MHSATRAPILAHLLSHGRPTENLACESGVATRISDVGLLSASVQAQAPRQPGRLPPLPPTQFDERAFAADRNNRKSSGIGGGWFGRATVETKERVALLILLASRIVS